MPTTTLKSQFDADTRRATGAKIVKRNTFQRTEADGTVIIRLHRTDIVRKHPDGSVTLDSGGWQTPTTKDRMQDHLPAGVFLYQEKGQWWLTPRPHAWGTDHGERVPYYDGICVPQCFTDAKAKATAAKAMGKAAALRKQIAGFVSKLDKLECLPEPSTGDCWYCMMKDASTGKPLGDAMGDTDHLRSHLGEGYLHGSLVLNALTWAGYPNPGLIFHMENSDRKQGRKGYWVKRALRRYLQAKLGLAR